MRIYALLLLFIFFLVEYFFIGSLSFFDGRGIYLFEFLFVVVIYRVFRQPIPWFNFKLKEWARLGLIFTLIGFVLAILTKVFSWPVAFDLNRAETIIMLVLVGPILEEFLYRYALKEAFQKVCSHEKLSLIVTSIVFSFGHFYSYFSLTDDYKSFVLFQTVYTFLLAITLSLDLSEKKNFLRVVAMHVFFNAGFLIGLWF